MKAMLINDYGGPDLIVQSEVQRPACGAKEVLVQNAASSFNPLDGLLRSGAVKDRLPLKFPYILGADVAGVVVEVGSDVTDLKVGDRVIAYANVTSMGATSQYVAISPEQVSKAPRDLPLVDGAALPLVGCTSWQALFMHGNLKSGQSLLMVGASGGVGTMAVQLGKWCGAHVTAVASERHHDRVRSLGATTVLDYSKGPVHTQVDEPFDLIFNASATPADELNELLNCLKPGGTLVSAAAPADPERASALGVTTIRMASERRGDHLAEIVKLVDGGQLKPVISAYVPMDQLASVHASNGGEFGKVVITIDSSL